VSFLTSDLPSTLLLIAIGIIVGAALTKILNRGPNSAELQQKLEDTQEQFNQYQNNVSEHFQKTAELVNNLTQSYQDVHHHLSKGAQSLAQNTPNALESNAFKSLSNDEKSTPENTIESSENNSSSEPSKSSAEKTEQSIKESTEENTENFSDANQQGKAEK